MKKVSLILLLFLLLPYVGFSNTSGPNIFVQNGTDLNVYAAISSWNITPLTLFSGPVPPKSSQRVGVGHFDDQSGYWDISFFLKIGDEPLTVRNSTSIHATERSIRTGMFIFLDDGRCYRALAEWSFNPIIISINPTCAGNNVTHVKSNP